MARSAAPGGRRRNPRAAPKSDADRIIEAALGLVATDGWRHLSLAAVAAAAEVPIGQIYRLFGSKQGILCGLYRRIDEAGLTEPPPAPAGGHARGRVFSLLPRRFFAPWAYKT